jgi:hypothetical protein
MSSTAQNVAFVQQLASQYQQQQPAVQPEQAGGNFFLKTANKVIPTLPQFRGNTNESVEFTMYVFNSAWIHSRILLVAGSVKTKY